MVQEENYKLLCRNNLQLFTYIIINKIKYLINTIKY